MTHGWSSATHCDPMVLVKLGGWKPDRSIPDRWSDRLNRDRFAFEVKVSWVIFYIKNRSKQPSSSTHTNAMNVRWRSFGKWNAPSSFQTISFGRWLVSQSVRQLEEDAMIEALVTQQQPTTTNRNHGSRWLHNDVINAPQIDLRRRRRQMKKGEQWGLQGNVGFCSTVAW